MALQFLYTSRGVPCLYYGTEQGFEGDNNNNDNREDMFAGGWQPQVPVAGDNFNETQPLFQQVARLNNFAGYIPRCARGCRIFVCQYERPRAVCLFARAQQRGGVHLFQHGQFEPDADQLSDHLHPGTVLVNLLNTNDTVTVISGAGTNETPSITVPAPPRRCTLLSH